jgi:hypothetical protein
MPRLLQRGRRATTRLSEWARWSCRIV